MLEETSDPITLGDAPDLAPPTPPAADPLAASEPSLVATLAPPEAIPPPAPADVVDVSEPAAASSSPPPPQSLTAAPPPPPAAAAAAAVASAPPAPPPSAAADASSSAPVVPDEPIVHDVVLATSNPVPRSAGSTSLASTVEIINTVSTVHDLQVLLQSACIREMSGAHVHSVDRCVQYVSGLARDNERVFCGWPVLSINEWGTQQVRTIVLTSHAVYRVAFSDKKGSIDHYSRTSLGSCRLIERGRHAFKLHLTEPDGRENPFTYFWSAYVKNGAKDNRYERVYYPIHDEGVPVELAIACMVAAISVANRILVEAIGDYCYVARTEVRDYVPSAGALDDFVDRVGDRVERVGSKVSQKIKQLIK